MRVFTFTLSIIISVFLFLSCGTESTPTYTLSTSIVGEGTISPSGGEYEEGEVVTLIASPNEHWIFQNWSGDGSGSSSTVTITMDRDKSVVGNFQRKDYPLTITIEGEGTVGERIVSSPKTTDYPYETVVQLTPIPSNGWKFVEWGGGLSGDVIPNQITISGEKNVTVKFSPVVYLSDNGITIMCPDGQVGDIGIVDGVEYEVVDNDLLLQRLEEGRGQFNRKVCVSLVTDLSSLFSGLNFNQHIGDWDVSSVTNMSRMFQGNSSSRTPFNQPIGEWDVSNVTNMFRMFYLSEFNHPIDHWDVGKVTDMYGLFQQTPFNQPIENWDVSNVTDMSQMFLRSSFNQPIGNWDVSNVVGMRSMFHVAPFNQPIENWDVSNVTNMSTMFSGSPFNQNLSKWCVWRIGSEPQSFSSSYLLTDYKPKWGTCPD